MVTKVSGSYVHNVICDVCGRKFKSYELEKRWDGYMVCAKDWEQRNILDFYRVRNDVHQLDWTRSDDESGKTWTPSFVNLTQTVGTGSITITGFYTPNNITNVINIQVQISITGNATTAASGATVSLPTTSVSAGTVRVLDGSGVLLGMGTIGVGATTATLPNWVARNKNIIITGQYGS